MAAGCCAAAQIIARLIVAQASGLWRIVPLPAFGPMTPDVALAWDFLGGWSYLPLSARVGSLSMGVLVVLAVSDERWRQIISRQVCRKVSDHINQVSVHMHTVQPSLDTAMSSCAMTQRVMQLCTDVLVTLSQTGSQLQFFCGTGIMCCVGGGGRSQQQC